MLKKLLSILLFSFLFLNVNAQVNIQWTDRFTRVGNNLDKAEDMALDAAGNVYICGTTWNGTSYDFLTAKYNPAGVLQWDTTYNGAGNSIDEARAIAVSPAGDVYVTGASYFTAGNDDYLTIKYNTNGIPQWIKNYNGPGNSTDEAFDIALDAAGNVFVTGGSTGLAATSEDYATLKYDPITGNQLFLARYSFSGANIDKAQAITVDATGNVYVTGYSYGSAALDLDYATLKYDNNLTLVWGASRYNGVGSGIDQAKSIKVSAAGNVYVTGYSRNTYILDDDITTVMYNSAGAQQWVSRYGAGNNVGDRSYGITVDASGNSYVVGMIKNVGTNQDMATIKYNLAGVQQWATEYNGPSNAWDEAHACVLEPTGTYLYVTGFSQSPGTNQDVCTLKYATVDGSELWNVKYSYTGNNIDQGFAIALDANENVYVAGESSGGSTSGMDAITIKYCQLTANAGADDAICLGGSTTLNASATNAVSYLWSPATGLSCTTCQSPTANPTITTTYAVTITNTTGCTDVDSVHIVVYPLPAPAITPSGPTTFCNGGSVIICSANNNNYSWAPGGATTQCITAITSNNYTCYITDPNGCTANSSIVVTVNPNPVANAGADTSVCLSSTAQLHASGAGPGGSYSWAPAGSLSDATVSNPQAGMVVSTTYSVWVTTAAGCTGEDSMRVTIVGNPPVPSLTYNMGVVCSSVATCYQWYQAPSTLINGATSQCYTIPSNGTYYVVVCNAAGCTTASATINVIDIGIGEIDNYFGSSVYPNPSAGSFTLQMALSTQQNIDLKIFNAMGEEIITKNIGNVVGDIKELFDLSDRSKGLYFIQITSDQGIATRRIIIE